jgi:penicillin-binding protein 1A
MVVENPQSGRVLAMQGGFDPGLGSFNRATQAKRQPGSTIKPFVYATALDFGMTPATMVLDGSFCVYQGAALGQKCFRNFDMRGAGGTHTMRWGLEQSRNLMTVHIANDTGMDRVVKTIDRVGIGKYEPYLSYALGAGETTVLQMVNAYAALANGGVQYEPSVIDFVQDRTGKVIWRADNRRCTHCNMAQWDGKPMPRLIRNGKQVLDPRTAYQTVHMLEGVVTRGTAVTLRDLGLPLFGKTGTTSGPTNVWFVGGSPEIVSGVYLGFDTPRSLGGYAQGGTFAAPIFKQLVQSTRSRWSAKPFVAPADVRMVRIDRVSGKRVFDGEPTSDPKSSIIWEAFKADTEPRRSTRQDDLAGQRDALIAALRRGSQAVQVQKQQQAAPEAEPRITSEDVVGAVLAEEKAGAR